MVIERVRVSKSKKLDHITLTCCRYFSFLFLFSLCFIFFFTVTVIMILQTVYLIFGMTLRWFFIFDLCLASNVHKLSNRKMLKSSINHCISGRHRAWRWKILQRGSLRRSRVSSTLPATASPSLPSAEGKRSRGGGGTCTHIGSWWLRVQIRWPWASACTTHTPSNRSGLIECEPPPPTTTTCLSWEGGAHNPSSPTDGWGTLRLLGTGATDD